MSVDKDDIRRKIFDWLEAAFYSTRTLLIFLYAGLTLCIFVFIYVMCKELWSLLQVLIASPDDYFEKVTVGVLSLVDLGMLGALIHQISVGSYSIFVRKIGENHKRKPAWLEGLTPGSLKVKIAMSITSVALVHLLKILVETSDVWVKLAIVVVFIVGMVAITLTDKIVASMHSQAHKEDFHEKKGDVE